MKRYPEWFALPPVGDVKTDEVYASAHANRPTYMEILRRIRALHDSVSVLDVGCGSLNLLRHVGDQYKVRVGVDPYQPVNFCYDCAQFIHGDFLDVVVPQADVVVCMEALEHVRPDRRRDFAQRLLQLARKHLFFSIPYNWQGSDEPVPHNGFNESNVMEWFWPIMPDEACEMSAHYMGHFAR